MGEEKRRGPKPQPPRPTPLRGRPEPPGGLDVEAAQHWEDILSAMDRADILSLLDRDALTIYIHLWMTYRHAKRMVDRPREQGGGMVLNGDRGPVASPWYKIQQTAVRDMKSFMDRFGLTPLGRSKLKIVADDPAGSEKWGGFGVTG